MEPGKFNVYPGERLVKAGPLRIGKRTYRAGEDTGTPHLRKGILLEGKSLVFRRDPSVAAAQLS